MINKAKISSAFISLLLLLAFSLTIVPLDLFHDHHTRPTLCKTADKTGSCQHKLHLAEKPAKCWICGIHYDKVFTKPLVPEKSIANSTTTRYLEKGAESYYTRLIFSSLRGPPVG